MIDPRTQYILNKERQHELMAQIERRLAAQERVGARGTGGAGNIRQAWYSAPQHWLKEKVLYRGLAAGRSIAAGKSR